VGEGQGTETGWEGKDPHRGHGRVCGGDGVCVGVRQGMVKVRL